MSDSGGERTDARKPAKRSFFTKASWIDAEASANKDTPDLFGRATTSFAEIVAEKEKKRSERLAKKHALPERKKDRSDRAGKRKRTGHETLHSNDAEMPLLGVHVEGITGLDNLDPPSPQKAPSLLPVTSGQRPEPLAKSKQNAIFIDLDDNDDEITERRLHVGAEKVPPTRIPEEVQREEKDDHEEDGEEQENDPIFRELAARVRERRRLRELEATKPTTLGRPQPSPAHALPETLHQSLDAVIKILITSPLPDTSPLIVARKLSQRLQEVRVAWCRKQGFSDEKIGTVFLTYRNKRLYDVTTCKSLGISVDENGNTYTRDQSRILSDDDFDKIHLEALTDELYMERKKQAADAALQFNTTDVEAEEDGLPDPEEQKIRLYLRARGYEEFRLEVRKDTSISRIANAFRIKREVSSNMSISLIFDGDRLEDGATVESLDIADEDVIEVHIKGK